MHWSGCAKAIAAALLLAGQMGATRPALHAGPTTAPATQTGGNSAEQLPTTRPAQRAAVPVPAQLDQARKQIWKQFRSDYDQPNPTDRDAVAHKLLRLALKEDTDSASRFALLREVQELAADARDEPLALKSAEAVALFFEVDPIEQKLHALSAAPWPDDSEETAGPLMRDWLALSREATAAREFEQAHAAANRALAVARHWGDEQWIATAQRQIEQIHHDRQQQAIIDQAKIILAAHPDDPQANQVLGCHAVSHGDWDGGLPKLAKAADPILRLTAGKDLGNPAGATARIDLAEGWTAAAQRQSGALADSFARRARHWYALALPVLPQADKKEIQRRMLELPGGSIFEVVAAGAAAPRHSKVIGGAGKQAFTEFPPKGALLIGLRMSVGPVYGNPCISSIQSVFVSESGKELDGEVRGRKQGDITAIEAKEGYAVGSIIAKTGWAVDGLKVVFMKITPNGLDPKDSYESQWLGGRGGSAERTLGGDGKPLIGIDVHVGDGVDGLGVIQSP